MRVNFVPSRQIPDKNPRFGATVAPFPKIQTVRYGDTPENTEYGENPLCRGAAAHRTSMTETTEYLTADDAANYLGVSKRTVEDWRIRANITDPIVRRGLLGIRIVGVIRYRKADIDAAIARLAELEHGNTNPR